MAVQTSLCLILLSVFVFLCSFCDGYKFHVGGRDGWVLKPSESYSQWAERNRFQVNDTLLFRFTKGEDSVLVVTKENYDQCNVNNPIMSLTEGQSEYKFEKSGPHYFISGNLDHCNKGQKIIIVVLAIRPKKSPPSPSPPSQVPVVSPPGRPLSPQTPSASPTPNSVDGQSQGEKKNSGSVYGSSLLGVVLSVVIGADVFFG